MGQQVTDGDRQVMVGVHQPRARGNDAVPIGIRVVGKSDPIAILEPNKPRHRVGARAVLTDLAVMIDGHERKGRVDPRVDYIDIDLIEGVDWLPVMNGSAAKRVYCELEPGGANNLHIYDVPQVVDIRVDKILLMSIGAIQGGGERHAFNFGIAFSQKLVGPVLDPVGYIDIGRPAIGRIVFEAAILWRIM